MENKNRRQLLYFSPFTISSSRGASHYFGTWNFGKSHCRCFFTGRFRHVHSFVLQTFWQMDFSTQERFFLAQRHFGTVAQVPKCLCQNVHISLQGSRNPCGEMFRCQNVPVQKCSCAKNSLCWKVPMSKCSHVELCICRNRAATGLNGAHAEMFWWWNIHVEMTLA